MSHELYVIGHPVAHSKSPAMYNAVYPLLGLDWHYGAKDIEDEREARAFIDAKDYVSINITMPWKPVAFAAADIKAATAQLAEGVNLLVPKDGRLIGYNTDGSGCVANLERLGFDFRGKDVVVCGTGPTSLAILHAAAVAGANSVTLLGRDKDKAQRILRGYVDRFGKLSRQAVDLPAGRSGDRTFRETYEDTDFKYGAYETSRNAIESADIVLDATPLGMKPGDPAPFDTALLHGGQWVFDAVYGHGATTLSRGAQQAGAHFVDGRGMLVGQAVITVQTICDINGISLALGFDELFDTMYHAAGFDAD